MVAFNGLLKKEFYITRQWFITWMIIMMIAIIASFVISYRMHEPMVTVGIHIALAVFHFGFLPIMLLSSLKLEGKTQLWLYNPQSSKTLLLAKITILFIYQIISQIILVLSTMIVYKYVEAHGLRLDHFPFSTYAVLNIFLFITGLYFSCWILFYWCFYHSLGKYPSIKKIRWLFILILFFIINAIESFLMRMEPLKNFISKWKQPMNINPKFHYEVSSHTWNLHYEMVQSSIIPFIIYAIVAITLYYISCWLLDKKVEV